MTRLEESFRKVTSFFGQQSQTFIYSLYVTLLKDNEYNHEAVIRKILDSSKDTKQVLGNTPMQSSVPPSSPSSYCPSYVGSYNSPSPSSPLLPSAFHPSLGCYSPLIPGYSPYSFSAYQNSSAIGHPGLEQPSPSMLTSLCTYYPTYHSSSGGLTPSTITSDIRFTPPMRPGDTSGDSRGSTEYNVKDDSDKESPGEAQLSSSINLTNASIHNLRKRSRNHSPFPEHYNLNLAYQDRRETAANA